MKSWMSAFAVAMILATAPAIAQDRYPNKPIRLVVPFPAGGSTDIIGRLVAQKLSERLGQSVVVDNRGGAGGTIGTDNAAKSPADGYTLLLSTTSTLAVAPAAYSKLGYDPVRDFAPVSLVAITPYLLVVNTGVKANTLAEFVALAKSQPAKLNYASAGNGTTTHLAMEMLKDAAGVDVVHIPFKGNAPAEVAVLAGDVQALFGSMPAILQQTKAGKLRPLAVGSSARSPALPDVPTVAESGYPGFEATLWLGVSAPAGTPKAVLDRLEMELRAIVGTADFRDGLARNGADAIATTSAEFAKVIAGDLERYGKAVKSANIKLD
ncbi:MAG TPA: tripartite tricarboxylate transporter substrate binding protein [Casimicrobiaceae bacterium]|nr:tripartite tricarboxylate transporter substrate binding protein [Casimicrobiaceae bacterium]